jgi:hypothetical protein
VPGSLFVFFPGSFFYEKQAMRAFSARLGQLGAKLTEIITKTLTDRPTDGQTYMMTYRAAIAKYYVNKYMQIREVW